MTTAFASWSGGKESCLSTYRARQRGIELTTLVNMVTQDAAHSMTHGISAGVLAAQASCIGLPLIQRKTSWDAYRDDFLAVMRELKQEGITAGVFGDIDLEEHRAWVEGVCHDAGIAALEPLWQVPRDDVVRELLDAGFTALLVWVRDDVIDPSWLGRPLDDDFLAHLRANGVDVCGEGGEYHTLVVDGPLFSRRLEVQKASAVKKRDGHGLEITGYRIMEK